MIDIRRLSAANAVEYRTLMLEAYERFADAFTSTPAERRVLPLSWWEKRVASADGSSVVFGAFTDQGLVGAVGIDFETKDKTKHKSSLFGMYVIPGQRGHGIGRELVAAAIAHAEARPGSVVIQLSLTEGNESALKLYESFGFATFGVEPMGISSGGKFCGKVLMWRMTAAGASAEPA